MLYKPYIDIKLTENWEKCIGLDYACALNIIKSFYLYFLPSLKQVSFSASRCYPSSLTTLQDQLLKEFSPLSWFLHLQQTKYFFLYSTWKKIINPESVKQLHRDYMVSTKTPVGKPRCPPFLLWLLKIVLERTDVPYTGGGFPALGPAQLFLSETAVFDELLYLISSFLLTVLSTTKSTPLLQRGPSQDSYQHF